MPTALRSLMRCWEAYFACCRQRRNGQRTVQRCCVNAMLAGKVESSTVQVGRCRRGRFWRGVQCAKMPAGQTELSHAQRIPPTSVSAPNPSHPSSTRPIAAAFALPLHRSASRKAQDTTVCHGPMPRVLPERRGVLPLGCEDFVELDVDARRGDGRGWRRCGVGV